MQSGEKNSFCKKLKKHFRIQLKMSIFAIRYENSIKREYKEQYINSRK